MQSRKAKVHPNLQALHSGAAGAVSSDSDSRFLSSKQQRALVPGVAQLQHTVPHPPTNSPTNGTH